MNYFRRLIDNNDPASVKRFIGLCMSAHLIVTAFFLTFAKTINANTELIDRILLYDVIIICVSIFGLAVEKIADILLSVSKTKAAAQILTPPHPVTRVDNVEGDVNSGTTDEPVEDLGDTIFEEEEEYLTDIKKDLTKSLKTKSTE